MKKRLCILFFLIGWFPSVYGQRSDNGNYVLLLNSASFGEAWSDVLYRSLVEEVRQQGVRVDTEELLVPMMKTPEDARAKREMLLAKYPVPPRAVIYIGDPGWLVCRPLFDREWKEVPTVICYSRDSMPASIEDLLGGNLDSRTAVPASEIAEGYNLTILKQPSFIRETIEMMRQLQPGMNTVALISDHRYISLRIREEVRQTVKKYFPDLAFESLSTPELTTGQLLDTLSGFDDKKGIIYYSWFVTQNRHEYLDDHVQRVIFGLAHTPIFTLTDRDHEEGSFAGGYYIPAPLSGKFSKESRPATSLGETAALRRLTSTITTSYTKGSIRPCFRKTPYIRRFLRAFSRNTNFTWSFWERCFCCWYRRS